LKVQILVDLGADLLPAVSFNGRQS
jgi:hypothetical protein